MSWWSVLTIKLPLVKLFWAFDRTYWAEPFLDIIRKSFVITYTPQYELYHVPVLKYNFTAGTPILVLLGTPILVLLSIPFELYNCILACPINHFKSIFLLPVQGSPLLALPIPFELLCHCQLHHDLWHVGLRQRWRLGTRRRRWGGGNWCKGFREIATPGTR